MEKTTLCPYCKLEGKENSIYKIELESNMFEERFACLECKRVMKKATLLSQAGQLVWMSIGVKAALSILGLDGVDDLLDQG